MLGVGTVVSSGGEADLWLALVATVVVALAFQPARERAQRLANRLVYGQRATPYEVLADLSRRMAGALSVDEVLPRMAEAAARGVGAARSRVRVYVPGGADRVVSWPQGTTSETFERTVLVLHQGAPAGELAVTRPPGERLTRAEEKLLSDLAAQAGPALENVRLNLQLQSRLEELQASRQRIVAAQDAERRRLERDLHDGAQQGLVALAVTARLARELVRTEPAEAESLLEEVSLQANEALGTLRDLARGIFPTALADRGLAAALEAHVAKVSPRPTFETDAVLGTRRFTPELEAGVYFCILEALQNCSMYAPDAPARVELASDDGWLVFSVTDQGPGFDQATTAPGSGLQNIADRLAAMGGGLDVRSKPGAGTTVSGRLPMRGSDAVDREGASQSLERASAVGSQQSDR